MTGPDLLIATRIVITSVDISCSFAIPISHEFQDACQNILCNTCAFFLSDVSRICFEVVGF